MDKFALLALIIWSPDCQDCKSVLVGTYDTDQQCAESMSAWLASTRRYLDKAGLSVPYLAACTPPRHLPAQYLADRIVGVVDGEQTVLVGKRGADKAGSRGDNRGDPILARSENPKRD